MSVHRTHAHSRRASPGILLARRPHILRDSHPRRLSEQRHRHHRRQLPPATPLRLHPRSRNDPRALPPHPGLPSKNQPQSRRRLVPTHRLSLDRTRSAKDRRKRRGGEKPARVSRMHSAQHPQRTVGNLRRRRQNRSAQVRKTRQLQRRVRLRQKYRTVPRVRRMIISLDSFRLLEYYSL